MSDNSIADAARELALLDQLVREYNQHRRDIAVADQVVELRLAAFKKQLEAWRKTAVKAPLAAMAELEPIIADHVKRITDGSRKKSINLPGGKVGFRKLPPVFTFNGERADANNAAFVEKLAADHSEYIHYKPVLAWSAMRRHLNITDNAVVDKNGEFIEGLVGTERPDSLFIEEVNIE